MKNLTSSPSDVFPSHVSPMKGANLMLTLNRSNEQLSGHYIPLPASWPVPKFSYNQLVTWQTGKYVQGTIVGMEYQQDEWAYSIKVDPDCPYLSGLICDNPEMDFIYESDLILVNS
jgi:hypothetical protein